eukprot:GHVT01009252.1.p1 GENE.GHVT01009252.1~~GHVT01009252.1.p1  ORF type:complete len:368 (+),score=104.02 GHVT01009252.1:3511-4614(+)
MATEFGKAVVELEALKDVAEVLLNCENGDALDCELERYADLEVRMKSLEWTARTIRKKAAASKNPDEAIYGERMLIKAKDFLEKFDILHDTFEEEIMPAFSGRAAMAKARAEKLKAAAEVAAVAEREERIRLGRQETAAEEEVRRQKLLSAKRCQTLQEEAAAKLAEEEKLAVGHAQIALSAFLEEYRATEQQIAGNVELRISACLRGLRELATAPGGLSCRGSIRSLAQLVDEITKSPSDGSKRLLRLGNESFDRQLGSKPGAVAILQGVGFKLKFAHELQAQLNLLEQRSGKPTELYFFLEEPDILQDYERWKLWLSDLEAMRDRLARALQVVEDAVAEAGRESDLAAAVRTAIRKFCAKAEEQT